ncbi:MAG TPA: hypothetical protein VKR78_05645 [Acidimicrobiales bacterium]|nr:hypothetical protein [Acidimicrobiales bacterium]
MARNRGGGATCALEGCEVPVVRRTGGGRPRLYCSDAHRAEARRRRLTSSPPYDPGAGGASGEDPIEGVRALLTEALRTLERAGELAPRDDARLAAVRAEATAEVLRAQQSAADAARQAAAAHDRLQRERGEWHDTVQELARERAEQAQLVEELSGALDGARAELEEELLRHHGDAARTESLFQAQRAAHAAEIERAADELDELRQRLAAALGAAGQAEQRAQRAEGLLEERAAAALELEVRAARAEEQSRLAAVRLEEARADVSRLRRELSDERRHHRAAEAELRRRAGQSSSRGAPRIRRPSSGPAATGAPGTSR